MCNHSYKSAFLFIKLEICTIVASIFVCSFFFKSENTIIFIDSFWLLWFPLQKLWCCKGGLTRVLYSHGLAYFTVSFIRSRHTERYHSQAMRVWRACVQRRDSIKMFHLLLIFYVNRPINYFCFYNVFIYVQYYKKKTI